MPNGGKGAIAKIYVETEVVDNFKQQAAKIKSGLGNSLKDIKDLDLNFGFETESMAKAAGKELNEVMRLATSQKLERLDFSGIFPGLTDYLKDNSIADELKLQVVQGLRKGLEDFSRLSSTKDIENLIRIGDGTDVWSNLLLSNAAKDVIGSFDLKKKDNDIFLKQFKTLTSSNIRKDSGSFIQDLQQLLSLKATADNKEYQDVIKYLVSGRYYDARSKKEQLMFELPAINDALRINDFYKKGEQDKLTEKDIRNFAGYFGRLQYLTTVSDDEGLHEIYNGIIKNKHFDELFNPKNPKEGLAPDQLAIFREVVDQVIKASQYKDAQYQAMDKQAFKSDVSQAVNALFAASGDNGTIARLSPLIQGWEEKAVSVSADQLLAETIKSLGIRFEDNGLKAGDDSAERAERAAGRAEQAADRAETASETAVQAAEDIRQAIEDGIPQTDDERNDKPQSQEPSTQADDTAEHIADGAEADAENAERIAESLEEKKEQLESGLNIFRDKAKGLKEANEKYRKAIEEIYDDIKTPEEALQLLKEKSAQLQQADSEFKGIESKRNSFTNPSNSEEIAIVEEYNQRRANLEQAIIEYNKAGRLAVDRKVNPEDIRQNLVDEELLSFDSRGERVLEQYIDHLKQVIADNEKDIKSWEDLVSQYQSQLDQLNTGQIGQTGQQLDQQQNAIIEEINNINEQIDKFEKTKKELPKRFKNEREFIDSLITQRSEINSTLKRKTTPNNYQEALDDIKNNIEQLKESEKAFKEIEIQFNALDKKDISVKAHQIHVEYEKRLADLQRAAYAYNRSKENAEQFEEYNEQDVQGLLNQAGYDTAEGFLGQNISTQQLHKALKQRMKELKENIPQRESWYKDSVKYDEIRYQRRIDELIQQRNELEQKLPHDNLALDTGHKEVKQVQKTREELQAEREKLEAEIQKSSQAMTEAEGQINQIDTTISKTKQNIEDNTMMRLPAVKAAEQSANQKKAKLEETKRSLEQIREEKEQLEKELVDVIEQENKAKTAQKRKDWYNDALYGQEEGLGDINIPFEFGKPQKKKAAAQLREFTRMWKEYDKRLQVPEEFRGDAEIETTYPDVIRYLHYRAFQEAEKHGVSNTILDQNRFSFDNDAIAEMNKKLLEEWWSQQYDAYNKADEIVRQNAEKMNRLHQLQAQEKELQAAQPRQEQEYARAQHDIGGTQQVEEQIQRDKDKLAQLQQQRAEQQHIYDDAKRIQEESLQRQAEIDRMIAEAESREQQAPPSTPTTNESGGGNGNASIEHSQTESEVSQLQKSREELQAEREKLAEEIRQSTEMMNEAEKQIALIDKEVNRINSTTNNNNSHDIDQHDESNGILNVQAQQLLSDIKQQDYIFPKKSIFALQNKVRKIDEDIINSAIQNIQLNQNPLDYVKENTWDANRKRVTEYVKELMNNPALKIAEDKSEIQDILKHFQAGEYIADPKTLLFSLSAKSHQGYSQFNLNNIIKEWGFPDTHRETMVRMLNGLSFNYPDMINFSDTFGLGNITLKEFKGINSNQNILNQLQQQRNEQQRIYDEAKAVQEEKARQLEELDRLIAETGVRESASPTTTQEKPITSSEPPLSSSGTQTADGIQQEGTEADNAADKMKALADAKKEALEANRQLAESADTTTNAIRNESNVGNFDELISKLIEAAKLLSQLPQSFEGFKGFDLEPLNNLSQAIQQFPKEGFNISLGDSFDNLANNIDKTLQKVQELTSQAKNAEIESTIAEKYDEQIKQLKADVEEAKRVIEELKKTKQDIQKTTPTTQSKKQETPVPIPVEPYFEDKIIGTNYGFLKEAQQKLFDAKTVQDFQNALQEVESILQRIQALENEAVQKHATSMDVLYMAHNGSMPSEYENKMPELAKGRLESSANLKSLTDNFVSEQQKMIDVLQSKLNSIEIIPEEVQVNWGDQQREQYNRMAEGVKFAQASVKELGNVLSELQSKGFDAEQMKWFLELKEATTGSVDNLENQNNAFNNSVSTKSENYLSKLSGAEKRLQKIKNDSEKLIYIDPSLNDVLQQTEQHLKEIRKIKNTINKDPLQVLNPQFTNDTESYISQLYGTDDKQGVLNGFEQVSDRSQTDFDRIVSNYSRYTTALNKLFTDLAKGSAISADQLTKDLTRINDLASRLANGTGLNKNDLLTGELDFKADSTIVDAQTEATNKFAIAYEAMLTKIETNAESAKNRIEKIFGTEGITQGLDNNFIEGNAEGFNDFVQKANQVKKSLQDLEDIQDNIKNDKTWLLQEDNLKKYQQTMSVLTGSLRQVSEKSSDFKIADKLDVQKLRASTAQFIKDNPALSGADIAELQGYISQLQDKINNIDFKNIEDGIRKVKQDATEAGRTGDTFFSMLTQRFKSLGTYLLSFASFYEVINVFKQGINIVHELDDALTEMQKVSDESLASLREYQKTTFATANDIGTTAAQLQQSTADWLRLGEDLQQASQSAQTANVLFNVSEFDNIDEATTALVAMSAAYADAEKDIDKMDIVDRLNLIGNNYAIATDELATALQDGAATLQTAGNDLDEAIALTTAGEIKLPEYVATHI